MKCKIMKIWGNKWGKIEGVYTTISNSNFATAAGDLRLSEENSHAETQRGKENFLDNYIPQKLCTFFGDGSADERSAA